MFFLRTKISSCFTHQYKNSTQFRLYASLIASQNTNQIYITVDGTFLAIRDKKTATYLAIDAGVPRIDLKTLNGIKHYKLTEI